MTLALLAPRSNQLSYYGSPHTRVGEAACGPGLTRVGTGRVGEARWVCKAGRDGKEEGGRGSSSVDASDRPEGRGKRRKIPMRGRGPKGRRLARSVPLPQRSASVSRSSSLIDGLFGEVRGVENGCEPTSNGPESPGDMPTATYWSAAFCSACALACAFTTCPTVHSDAMAEAGTAKHVLAADLALDGLGFGENIRTQEH